MLEEISSDRDHLQTINKIAKILKRKRTNQKKKKQNLNLYNISNLNKYNEYFFRFQSNNLNSAHVISYNGTYKSDIEFKFNDLLKQEEDIQQVQISSVNAQIPVPWYIINFTYNMFKIQLGNNRPKLYNFNVGKTGNAQLINA